MLCALAKINFALICSAQDGVLHVNLQGHQPDSRSRQSGGVSAMLPQTWKDDVWCVNFLGGVGGDPLTGDASGRVAFALVSGPQRRPL